MQQDSLSRVLEHCCCFVWRSVFIIGWCFPTSCLSSFQRVWWICSSTDWSAMGRVQYYR